MKDELLRLLENKKYNNKTWNDKADSIIVIEKLYLSFRSLEQSHRCLHMKHIMCHIYMQGSNFRKFKNYDSFLDMVKSLGVWKATINFKWKFWMSFQGEKNPVCLSISSKVKNITEVCEESSNKFKYKFYVFWLDLNFVVENFAKKFIKWK